MVSRDENKYVIYPLYFDSTVSRLNGRKVAKKYAVEKPSLENILKAAQSLKLKLIVEKDGIHSSTPWMKEGRILVEKKGPKTKLLVQIANRL
ncbi:Signal recognition particle 19 kDa protein [uncultured archaeon]|nr:Signal recognition particle 19 kDa protein [uncultured archaeon]